MSPLSQAPSACESSDCAAAYAARAKNTAQPRISEQTPFCHEVFRKEARWTRLTEPAQLRPAPRLPPPSTLAAQIVHNQTRPATQHGNGEIPSFPELLHEILHNHAAIPEKDVNINVRLIAVVAEAGLGPLNDGNPFAQWDTRLSLAEDSIAVIEATVKRQPEILFTPTKQYEPQLLVPLLARLAAVWGHQRCDGLPIRRLVESTLGTLYGSLDQWQNTNIVRQVLEDCILGKS